MEIKTNRLEYQFNDEGATESVRISFVGSENSNYVNSTIQLEQAELAEGKTFDDLSKKDIEVIGRDQLSELVKVEKAEPAE